MLINTGTLVYINKKEMEPAQRYAVVISSQHGKILVQQLLSEEAEMLTLSQEDVKLVFNPPKME